MTQERKLAILLRAHTESFEEIVAIAERNPYHPRLEFLRQRAASGISAVNFECHNPIYGTHGSAGHWGENGMAPYIRSLLEEARRIEAKLKESE
jgi:hypothetical protein